MRVKVEVTASCIKRGKRSDELLCPIALALKGALGRGSEASVGAGWITALKNGWALVDQPMPTKTCRFVSRFDDKRPVKPFSFMVNVLQPKDSK